MDRLDYDEEGGRLLLLKEFLPQVTPGLAYLNDLPLYQFPGEAAPAYDAKGKLIGYEFAARPDVLFRLREEIAAVETTAFEALADHYQGRVTEERQIANLPTVAIPHQPNFVKVLRPVQAKAIDFGLRHKFVLYAMDMGTGKTVTSLYAMQCLLTRGEVRRWLVISPVAGIDDAWRKEFGEASIPHVVATNAEKLHDVRNSFVVVGREQLLAFLRNGQNSPEHLIGTFDGYTLDESSVVKDTENVTHRLLADLRPCMNALFLLNGTPIENSVRELFNQIDLVQPGSLGSWEQFACRHGLRENERPSWPWLMKLVQTELADKMFVAKMENPHPVHEKTLWVELTGEQEELYQAWENRYDNAWDSGERLACYTRMQQAANDTGLLLDQYQPGHSAKRELLKELLPSLTLYGRKSLIYSQYREWIKPLALEFSGPDALTWIGGMTPSGRRDTLARIWNEEREQLLWANDAALKSLNLQCVWNVVNLDLPWGGVVYQLVARAMRGDTDHPVYWIRLMTNTRIDRKKERLVQEKRELLTACVRSLPEALKEGLLTWEDLA